jgi:hypothetical protein
MAKVPVSARIVAKSSNRKPLSILQVVRLAEIELAALKPWLARDPQSPHAAETGKRLAELAQLLIKQGGQQ